MTDRTGTDRDTAVAADLETDLELVGIVAVADNGVIGNDGEIPWHVPEDLRRFKAVTTGHPVILGRVTYESILERLGEPLPDRTSVVLTSRDPDALGTDVDAPENVVVARDLGSALRAADIAAAGRHDGVDRAFVAGGASVYEAFLPVLDRLLVTEIHEEPAGDTRFPDRDRTNWREVSRDQHDGFAFVEYVRRE